MISSGKRDQKLKLAFWSGTVLIGLALLIGTLIMGISSDLEHRPRVEALLVGDQPMIVLHEEPVISSGIAGLLPRLSKVTIVSYDPQGTPGWALVRSGAESGWVPLDRLAELPP